MLTLANPSVVPPGAGGAFVVNHPDTGWKARHVDVNLVVKQYQKYCSDNGLAVPGYDAVIDLMCAQHPEWCVDATTKRPTLAQKAMSLVREVAMWVRAGSPMPSNEVIEERLAICEACQFYAHGRCAKCGCYMEPKAYLATSSCPIGRWTAVDIKYP